MSLYEDILHFIVSGAVYLIFFLIHCTLMGLKHIRCVHSFINSCHQKRSSVWNILCSGFFILRHTILQTRLGFPTKFCSCQSLYRSMWKQIDLWWWIQPQWSLSSVHEVAWSMNTLTLWTTFALMLTGNLKEICLLEL